MTVTRKDREAALEAYWGAALAERLRDQDGYWVDWIERGSVIPITDAHLACVRIAAGYAQAREEGRRESRAGCFESQGDGTSKCAGCGFRVQGEVALIGRITLPKG